MEEIRENYQAIEEIKPQGPLLATINYKSQTAFIVCVIMGLGLCATMLWGFIIAGVIILALAVFVQVAVKDYRVLDVYEDCLVVYDLDPRYARKLGFGEITEWSGKHGGTGADAIMLKLNNEEVIYKDTFQMSKAYKALNRVLPDKESQAIKDKENQKSKLKFVNPFAKKSDKQ